MRPQANKGIIYPDDAVVVPDFSKPGPKRDYWKVPHKAWSECKDQLDKAFADMAGQKPSIIFVLAPLHKGKVFYEEPFCVYTYSDCTVEHEILNRNDDVTSEEYSYEMLIPYLDAYFPGVPSTVFLAPEKSKQLREFISYLRGTYPEALFIVSDSSLNCCGMWTEAF